MPKDLNIQPGMHLNCPHCAGVMARLELGAFCVDRCAACGGICLDASELERVKATQGAIPRIDPGKPGGGQAGRGRTPRLCPRDRTGLEERRDPRQAHVVVDRCPMCLGMFLDAGELRDLGEHTLVERVRGFFGG